MYRAWNETNLSYLSGGREGYRAIEPVNQYRGYTYSKDGGYNLYYLVCPKGKALSISLGGKFTKVAILEAAIDKYLSDTFGSSSTVRFSSD
jgi:hypothetical protein